MRIRDYVGISSAWQRRIAYGMELVLVGLLFIGIERGSTGIIVNTGVGLLVTQLPPILRRDFDVPMDPALTLWITSAVFLHALGTVGLPGSEANFYRTIPWWDNVTHALSSSVVAAAGYATARSFDEHAEGVSLPPRFMFVFILLFVLAFGVLWEVIEFVLAEAAALLGTGAILTQYGLEDTMVDLIFDTVGAVIVAIWGTAHLSDVVDAIGEYVTNRRTAD
ncbi:hypothetical protein [Halorientalis marina]|uniref:hypothetical protein n=1 Tax=Halorientalis marina TaxID=2931976 RepID=UPI001FF4B47C|nr:hypothetical protein [Halorientalis marina]